MPQYRLILLDADETLFDFTAAQNAALEKAFRAHNYPFGDCVIPLYTTLNKHYWKLLEQGKVSKTELLTLRFEDLLRQLGLEGDPVLLNETYLDHLSEGAFLLPGALETCKILAQHATLAIATNGVARVQHSRIARSEIAPLISHVIVSEEAGAAKPAPQFFNYALKTCGFAEKSAILMVGDNPEADIRGALDCGLAACWLNRTAQPPPAHVHKTQTITDIRQLVSLVLDEG